MSILLITHNLGIVGDMADRVAAYHTLQEQLAKDIPGITLLYDLYGNIYKPTVHGLPTPEANSLGAIKVTTIWMS